jgi:hypothetical protein
MRKLGIVSTFSDKGYHEYGKHFVESAKRFIDPNITVYIYVDNIDIGYVPANFVIRKLEPSVPELTEFKQRNAHKVPGKFIYATNCRRKLEGKRRKKPKGESVTKSR